MVFELRYATPAKWTDLVIEQMDTFLLDHAAAEKKASGMAMNMVSHYPDKTELVAAMVDLAIEELTHFRAVVKLISARGLHLGADQKDTYINQFRKQTRRGPEVYLMDRLLTAGIVEARGAIAEALEPGQLKRFYRSITRSEENHKNLFVDLAKIYFETEPIEQRLGELLDLEAEIVSGLPIKAALH